MENQSTLVFFSFFSFYDISIDSSSGSQEDKKAPSELSAPEVLHQEHETDRRFFGGGRGGKRREGKRRGVVLCHSWVCLRLLLCLLTHTVCSNSILYHSFILYSL